MTTFPDWMKIPFPQIKGDDGRIAFQFRNYFHSLQRYEDQFRHSVQLFEFSRGQSSAALQSIRIAGPRTPDDVSAQMEQRRNAMATLDMLRDWEFTAARDAVFSVYHFVEATKTLNDEMRKLPETSTPEIRKRLSNAHRIRDKHLSQIVGVRNSAAHLAEMERPKKQKEHAIKSSLGRTGLPAGTVYQGNLEGSEYVTGYFGELVRCDISAATISKIVECRMAFYSVFGPLTEDPFFGRSRTRPRHASDQTDRPTSSEDTPDHQ